LAETEWRESVDIANDVWPMVLKRRAERAKAGVRVPCEKCGAEMIGDRSPSFCFCETCCGPQPPRSTLLEAAEMAVNDRQKKNDIPERNFARIAQAWTPIFDCLVTPEKVALAMIALKVVRESYSHHPDNLVDIVGYTMCLEEIQNATPA
jgi:hypothetical protein